MKHIYLSILLVVLSLYTISAQDSHMALNAGVSVPFGGLSQSSDYTTSGYAGTGFDLSFDFNYIPTWYFGVGGGITFSTNNTNQERMAEDWIEELKKYDLPEIPDSAEKYISLGDWSYVNILLGPTLALPVNENLQFNFKILTGVTIAMPPEQTFMIKYDENTIAGYNDLQIVHLAVAFGSDMVYKINESYSIKLGVEYFMSAAKYDEKYVLNTDSQIPFIHKDISISALHCNIGLAHLF